MLKLRDSLPPEERKLKSRRIMERIMEYPAFCTARYILCYVDYKNEVETKELLLRCLESGKWVYCPAVSGKDMEFYRISSLKELLPGFHGILEPPQRQESLFLPHGKEKETLIIMPGAAFDKRRHRIGYGDGYYDRYQHSAGGIRSAALAFSFQVMEQNPYVAHDICPEILFTEDAAMA